MNNPTSLAELLLGLDGFQILEVIENPDELIIHIQTKNTMVGCPTCGVRAQAKDRMRVDIRDLPCFGRPARLVWMKRRWQCQDCDCDTKTWTEITDHFPRRTFTVYQCDSCDTRSLGEQRCENCGIFMRRIGYGGLCPCCEEPVAAIELVPDATEART